MNYQLLFCGVSTALIGVVVLFIFYIIKTEEEMRAYKRLKQDEMNERCRKCSKDKLAKKVLMNLFAPKMHCKECRANGGKRS